MAAIGNVMVSVLITTYNLEKYISHTLDTVLAQKADFEYELLIGDDGSNDRTIEILNEYQKRYDKISKVFVMDREEGVVYNRVERSSANRLNLLKHARGKYFIFLDGDDYYCTDSKLAKQVYELENNPELSVASHNMYMYYGDVAEDDYGSMPLLCRAKQKHIWSVTDYWPLVFIQANAMMIRNPYLCEGAMYKRAIGHLETNAGLISNFDDNNITFWALSFGKMLYLPEPMCCYRQSPESSWNGIDELKKHCSNMIGYSIELSIAPQLLKVIEIRHYPDFDYIYKNRQQLSKENCNPFYDTAKKCGLEKALEIYDININGKMKNFESLLGRARKGYHLNKAKRCILKRMKMY